jgi:hypothetical protein
MPEHRLSAAVRFAPVYGPPRWPVPPVTPLPLLIDTAQSSQRIAHTPAKARLHPDARSASGRPGGRARHARQPHSLAWRLCFAFVAQQLLVSANIVIMFDSVRSEAGVTLR